MLCGISSRFQLLSPTERQVSHALLTRSPLNLSSIDRNRFPISPVRLACVRHAASVRPEPGSNSQKIVSKQPFGCSNHLSNNLSSKYTQEFSLAVIRFKTLKQSILIVQGVSWFVFRYFSLISQLSFLLIVNSFTVIVNVINRVFITI